MMMTSHKLLVRWARNSRKQRSAVTILEVLFAVMVATIGLLGALAVFPVASSQARKGQIADQVASGGDMAVHAFDTMGMRRPDKWIWWDSTNGVFRFYTDTTVTPVDAANNSARGRESLLIDPMFISDNISGGVLTANASLNASVFPSIFSVGGTVATPSYFMRRISLNSGLGGPMGRLQAEGLFRFDDTPAWVRPGNQAVPAQQMFTSLNGNAQGLNQNPGKRQDEGRLSWMAMLVPKLNRQTQMVATDEYTLSIIIMENRVNTLTLADVPSTVNNPVDFLSEWFLNPTPAADFLSGGLQGGDVVVSASAPQFLAPIKRDSWVMLSTTLPVKLDDSSGTYAAPYPQHRWYRVVEASTVDTSTNQMNLTLLGADWTVGATNQVTVIPGVIAVHEKTIRLEQD